MRARARLRARLRVSWWEGQGLAHPFAADLGSISPHPQPDTRGWQHPRLTTSTADPAGCCSSARASCTPSLCCSSTRRRSSTTPCRHRPSPAPSPPHHRNTMRPKLARRLAHVHLLTTRPRMHAPTYHPPTFTHQHRRRRRPRVRFAGPHAPAGRSSGRSVGKPVDAAPPTSHRCATTCRCYTCSCRCCSARSPRPPMRGGGAAARTGQWTTQMATPTETPTETPTATPSRRTDGVASRPAAVVLPGCSLRLPMASCCPRCTLRGNPTLSHAHRAPPPTLRAVVAPYSREP